ncbi:MAG TPA: PEGA domain-containing protein, partial [Polyangiaceae bacterium]|nr:PEGA domain-containing protein [Polyangiaceae bacterium]
MATAALPSTARAQQPVSDADRNTARDLYKEGWALQQAGKYTDALDKYQRSIAVYSAPTTAFRIAQCKAALGQLVEAAEELRAVRDVQLPANAPEAFVKAKQEAATELQSVEPRIPKLKINVTPANATGLTVTIDGQPMPTALLGVGRAINPGTHKIVVVAPGYAQAEQSVDVREKQQPPPELNITLTAQAGVSYTPSGQGGGTTYGQQGGAYGQQGGAYGQQGGAYGQGGYQGPYGGGRPWVPPARPRGASTALLLGVHGVISVPFGDGPLPSNTSSATSLNDALGVGGGIGGEVGLRFARIVYLGASLQGSFYNANYAGASLAIDALLGFMSNPDGVGFYGE